MQIWATGDPTSANAIMSENVRCVDLLFVQETKGREEFKKMIHNVFKVSPLSCQGHIMIKTQSLYRLFVIMSGC